MKINRETKKELLEKYAQKNVNRYLQLDCFVDAYGDSIVRPDREGYAVFAGQVDELRSGGVAVRIQILEGTSKKNAIRAIKKLLDWAEREYCLLSSNNLGGSIWTESFDKLKERTTPELMEFLDQARVELRNFDPRVFDDEKQAEEVYTRWENSIQNVSVILIERLGKDSFELLTR